MGVDLRLLPIEFEDESLCYSFTVLPVPRDYALFDEIRECEQFEIQKHFSSFMGNPTCDECEERTYGDTKTDSYGTAIHYVLTRQLKKVFNKLYPKSGSPVHAYIDSISDDAKIALYWH